MHYLIFILSLVLAATLKKQVGCFNHRVVALPGCNHEWVMRGFFWYLRLIALGNHRGSCSGHLTTTILLIHRHRNQSGWSGHGQTILSQS